MKKILTLGLSALLVLGLVTGCGCKKQKTKKEELKVEVNTEKDVIKDQKVDGIDMTNTSLVTTNGSSKLLTKVTNNTDSDYILNEYTIIIKNKEGKVLTKVPGYLGDKIKKGETRIINATTDVDITGATSIEYEVKK